MFLTNQDVVELTEWRRTLHRMPELSGKEANTAREVAAFLRRPNRTASSQNSGVMGWRRSTRVRNRDLR